MKKQQSMLVSVSVLLTLDRIEASMKSFGERFEATRDEYKETKYKVASWSATVGLIVALVVNFVFSKFTGGN